MWVGSLYETLRLLEDRKLVADSEELRALAHGLRLLRIPLEKHEITSQGQLTERRDLSDRFLTLWEAAQPQVPP